MNREMKLRYYSKYSDGSIARDEFTIEEIEDGFIQKPYLSGIVARVQFTGLQDKNGQDIYEGDIFTANIYPFYHDELLNYVGVIVYDDRPDYMGWFYDLHVVSDRVPGAACGSGLAYLANADLTVIGNIYENQELCTN